MKLNFKKSTLVKLGLLLALLAVAPFLVPFTLEFIIVADLMGLEALIVFLFVYAKSVGNLLRFKLQRISQHISDTLRLLAELYMFKPKIYLSHATACSLVIICASSVMLACAVWLPVMMASAQIMGPWI